MVHPACALSRFTDRPVRNTSSYIHVVSRGQLAEGSYQVVRGAGVWRVAGTGGELFDRIGYIYAYDKYVRIAVRTYGPDAVPRHIPAAIPNQWQSQWRC